MSDTTMVVAAPAAAPLTPTAAASPTTSPGATAVPVDGAFTALLAVALGGTPAIASPLAHPVDGATTTTALVEDLLAEQADPSAETAEGETAPGIAAGDAGHHPEVPPTGPSGPIAATVVVPDAETARVGSGTVATDVADPTGGTAGMPLGPDPAGLVDEGAPTAVRGGLDAPPTPAAAPSADRPAAPAGATGAAHGIGPAGGTPGGTAPSAATPPAGPTPAAVPPAVSGAEAPVRTTPDPGTATPTPAPVAPAADVATPAVPAPAPTGNSDLHARLVARVMDALDVLENAPPPRRLTVDLPDAEGLRLQVSLRGGEVHVSIVGGASGADLGGWNRDLTEALAARGFSLGGFGAGSGRDERRQSGDEGQTPGDQSPTPSPRPRPRAADQGLRL